MALKFGIIGLGNIAPVHAAAIRGVKDAELVAVADIDAARGQAFVAEHGGTAYLDYHQLLGRKDLDVVSICTPHDLHTPIVLDAAAAGKHILCEKPMACNVADCDAMIAACEQAGVKLGVVFQGRFEPLALQLKEIIDSGRIGKLLWSSANTLWHRTDEYYRSGPWRGTWAHEGGGVLINQAIHALDLLLWLGGTPVRLSAQIRTLNHKIEVEDCALATLEYEGGQLGFIQATTIAYPGYPERLEFYGSNGSAIYHKGQAQLEWHIMDPKEDHVESAQASSGAARPMDISAAAHTEQFKEFTAAVHEGRKPSISGEDGRRSIELIEAIYRSAGQGSPITLPLAPVKK